jgi:hypothetical protein
MDNCPPNCANCLADYETTEVVEQWEDRNEDE